MMMHWSLLHTAEAARLQRYLWTAKGKSRVLLRGRAVVRMRIDMVPGTDWGRWMKVSLKFVVRHHRNVPQALGRPPGAKPASRVIAASIIYVQWLDAYGGCTETCAA